MARIYVLILFRQFILSVFDINTSIKKRIPSKLLPFKQKNILLLLRQSDRKPAEIRLSKESKKVVNTIATKIMHFTQSHRGFAFKKFCK